MLVLNLLLCLLGAVTSFAAVLAREPRVVTTKTKKLPPGEVFTNDADFNAGRYGYYITQTFKSSNVTAPRINMQKPFTACDDGSHLFITPRGELPETPAAVILDAS